jgi:hypothetical protein
LNAEMPLATRPCTSPADVFTTALGVGVALAAEAAYRKTTATIPA